MLETNTVLSYVYASSGASKNKGFALIVNNCIVQILLLPTLQNKVKLKQCKSFNFIEQNVPNLDSYCALLLETFTCLNLR